MSKYVRCKACGYITREGKLGDRCPACGAPKAAFEPYDDPMSARRRALLRLDLHPVSVHFPVSLTSVVLVFLILSAFLSGRAHAMLADTVKTLVLLLPALAIVAGIAGIIDGRTRFRKIKNSMILKRKILGACLLFVVLTAQTVIIWVAGFGGAGIAGAAVLGAIAVGIIVVLALMGRDIRVAAFPGD
jgi:rubredoxin